MRRSKTSLLKLPKKTSHNGTMIVLFEFKPNAENKASLSVGFIIVICRIAVSVEFPCFVIFLGICNC